MRIPWRRLIWAAVILVPVAAAGIILWLSTRDLSRYQARLTEQIRKVTGREITTRVKLSVKIGREPALVAEGVTLSNAPWASRPELARVRRVTMYLDPFALFLGEAKVGRVLLEGADITIERNEAGDTNLEMLPPPDGSGPHAGENRSLRLRGDPAFPWIGTIEVRNSMLTVSEGAGRPAGRAQRGARQLQVDRGQSASADRRERQRAAGDAARADRDDGFVRRLDEGPAGQHRRAGRLWRRQDRDQGQHRHQGHRSAGHQRGPGRRGFRPLYPPAAAVGRSLFADGEGRDPAQRPQGRGAVAQGRSVRAERRGAVSRRSQRHADHRGEHRRHQD